VILSNFGGSAHQLHWTLYFDVAVAGTIVKLLTDFILAMHTASVISTHIDVGVVVVDDINGADGANGAVGANG
jgi:cytochrome b561